MEQLNLLCFLNIMEFNLMNDFFILSVNSQYHVNYVIQCCFMKSKRYLPHATTLTPHIQ